VSGNRFINSDLSELQEVNRNPIFGYQRRPVMSLEEAVEGIVPFVPHVKTYADEAKQHCRQNTQLTINESAAIYLYTMPKPFYENFNKALRAENPLALEPWFAFLKLLINALRKLPSQPNTVWRGVGTDICSGFGEGDVHTWWSVNSCSSYVNVAGCFASPIGTLFCIQEIYGKNIAEYSANQCEEEIVLMPGTCLRVKSVQSERTGLSIVHLLEW
jgi:hypothetical protein